MAKRPDPRDAQRRAELAEFLRTRRGILRPEDCGLPRGFRRRTSGLRREEVAGLAGISAVWYAWLEQGRAVKASRSTLDQLASALHLPSEERSYLIRLALPDLKISEPRILSSVPEAVLRILGLFEGRPAYVRNRRWDVLAWNAAFEALYGNWFPTDGETPNVLWKFFADARFNEVVVNADANAQHTLARFRADFSEDPNNPAFADLIKRLLKASPDFRRSWPLHKVRDTYLLPVVVKSDRGEILEFDSVTIYPEAEVSLALVVHAPRNTRTTRILREILARRKRTLINARSPRSRQRRRK